MSHDFLESLALVLSVAAITTVISRRLRLPGVFGYLAAGLIVSPHTPLPLVASPEVVHSLSELGVILLMFALGLEFRLARVVALAGTAGLAAMAETSLMFGLGYTVASLFGWSVMERIFTGAIVSISSTTIIARTFAEQGVRGRLRDVVFGILVVEDLIAIVLIAALAALSGGAGLSGTQLFVTVVRLGTFLIALVAVGRWLLPPLMRGVIKLQSPETTVVVAVGLAFGSAILARSFGYSVALGAFVVGSMVAESGHGHDIEMLVAPVRDVFVAVFFVSAGMLIDPAAIAEHWGAVVALTAVVLSGKMIAVTIGAFITGNSLRLSVQAGVGLAQIGEFSFILAGVGLAAGATRPFLYPVAIAVSAITMLTTPFFIRRASQVALFVDRHLPHSLQTYVALYGSWVADLRHGSHARGDVRRAIWLIVLDVALLGGLLIAAIVEMGRLAVFVERKLGVGAPWGRVTVLSLAAVAAMPFLAGLVRMTRFVATTLALRAMPVPLSGKLDRAAAPRGAFVSTLQYGLLLAATVPLIALLNPLVPGLPLLGALVLLGVVALFGVWRSARTLYGHATAGAEVILMALTQHDRGRASDAELHQTMEHLAVMLPGLGDPEPVRLDGTERCCGRTLGELDLRGQTGATVLAIQRAGAGGQESVAPTGRVQLRPGDLVILAGSPEALAAAREFLKPGNTSGVPATAGA